MDINQKLAEAIKQNGIIKFVDIASDIDANKGTLSVEKFEQFVQEMREATVIMQNARFYGMTSPKKDIDRISMRIELEAPTRDGTTGAYTLTDQDPTFACNQLDVVKLMAKTQMTEETLEDNISQGTLESTLTSLFGAAGGEALERVFVYGDTSEVGAGVPTGYKAVDGWMSKVDAGNVLYGGDGDFDPTDIDDMFTKMYDALQPSYRKKAVFYVPDTYESNYRRALKSKDTDLGDRAILSNDQLYFEGRPVIPAPVLDEPITDGTFFGDIGCFFGPPEQFVYGMRRNVRVRSVEDIENEIFKFILSLRGDCHFEDETKVILAKPAATS